MFFDIFLAHQHSGIFISIAQSADDVFELGLEGLASAVQIIVQLLSLITNKMYICIQVDIQ